MASPVLKALKKNLYEHCTGKGAGCGEVKIHWLIDPKLAPLIETNPYVDQLIMWDKARWKELMHGWKRDVKGISGLVAEIRSFGRMLRLQHYDMALDLQGLFRSRFLSWLSGARERIGFSSREPGRFLMTRIVSKGPQDPMMGSEYLFLMKELGIEVTDPAPHVFISKSARKKALALLEDHGISGPYMAFSPFTTRPQKHWLHDRWSTLAASLTNRYGLPIVILGGPQDEEVGADLADTGRGTILSLAGRLTIDESAAVVAGATALIGVDTGLTHMGTALNTPTIALFGATRPYLKTPVNTTRVIYHRLPCSPCRRRPTCSDFPCMKAISCEEILGALGGLIEKG